MNAVTANKKRSLNDLRRESHQLNGTMDYHLELFGDELAKREKYRGIDGMEAIHLYLIRTYHWTPAYVKSMNTDDIRLVLTQEMRDFTVSG